jgi:hypothetical protein
MKAERTQVIGRAIYRAATSKLGLSAAALATAAGMVWQSALTCAVAAGGYLVAVSLDLRRNGRWRQAIRELRRQPPPLPSICRYHDMGSRQLLLRIEHARDERDRACRSLPAQAHVDQLMESAAALEGLAFRLLDGFDRVTTYLGSDPLGPLRADKLRLEQMALHTAGHLTAARAEYAGALGAVARRMRALEQTDGWRALLRARLENIAGVLEALPAAMVELELRHATAAVLEAESPLASLYEELYTLEEASSAVLRPLAAGPAAPALAPLAGELPARAPAAPATTPAQLPAPVRLPPPSRTAGAGPAPRPAPCPAPHPSPYPAPCASLTIPPAGWFHQGGAELGG